MGAARAHAPLKVTVWWEPLTARAGEVSERGAQREGMCTSWCLAACAICRRSGLLVWCTVDVHAYRHLRREKDAFNDNELEKRVHTRAMGNTRVYHTLAPRRHVDAQ